ncbi:MAG TPA: hypothetical protein VJ485_01730 [archaeon]|jgi:predicted extracellular nuclease|nr:hypothetical protein [archaeon]
MNVNKDLLRLGILAFFLAGILAISWLGGYLTGRTIYISPFSDDIPAEKMTVSGMLENPPLDQNVEAQGTVSRVMQDYVSKKGYQYQQFYISDGSKDLKVFCSKYKGSVDIQKGDNVSVIGKFQKYSNTYEIYTECNNVEVL